MNFPSYLCNVNQKITIMAKAEYKNLTKDYRNMSLMSAVGIALSSWREGFGTNEYGEFDDNHKQLRTWWRNFNGSCEVSPVHQAARPEV